MHWSDKIRPYHVYLILSYQFHLFLASAPFLRFILCIQNTSKLSTDTPTTCCCAQHGCKPSQGCTMLSPNVNFLRRHSRSNWHISWLSHRRKTKSAMDSLLCLCMGSWGTSWTIAVLASTNCISVRLFGKKRLSYWLLIEHLHEIWIAISTLWCVSNFLFAYESHRDWHGRIYRTFGIMVIPRTRQNTHTLISPKMCLISSSNTIWERPSW